MFVPIIEMLLISIPYKSHKAVLIVAIRNMVRETSFVDFDFHVFMTWGRKVVHDNNPAVIPIISLSMIFILILTKLMKEQTITLIPCCNQDRVYRSRPANYLLVPS